MASAFQGAVTEAFWGCHFERQAASEVSIRAYCREHGLAESSFYAWRRERDRRDAVRDRPSRRVNPPSRRVNPPSRRVNPPSRRVNPPSRRVPRARRTTKSPGRRGIRSCRMSATVVPCLAPRAADVVRAAAVSRERSACSDRRRSARDGHACLGSRSDGVGLVALEIVGGASPQPMEATASPTLEIVFPGGVVIRLREEVSAEVLRRVIGASEPSLRGAAESRGEDREVRSC